MGAAGLESSPMVGVDTSRPELPGLPTNESANTIPVVKDLHEGFEVAMGNTNFRNFEVILRKISFLCGSNSENIEQILNITLNIAYVQWLHYCQYVY